MEKKSKTGNVKAKISKRTTTRKSNSRADFGAPIDAFFAKQPPHLRVILEELRLLIEEAAPDAVSSLKWGMPWFTVNNKMMCSLGGHKSHVNLILMGSPDSFTDPNGLLLGEGKDGRHLRLTALSDLPRESVRQWLGIAADLARKKN